MYLDAICPVTRDHQDRCVRGWQRVDTGAIPLTDVLGQDASKNPDRCALSRASIPVLPRG